MSNTSTKDQPGWLADNPFGPLVDQQAELARAGAHAPPAVGDTVLDLDNPMRMAAAWRIASLIAGSDLVPPHFQGKPASVLVALEWGANLGLPWMQAVQNIAVVKGKPGIYGDLGRAIVTRHPETREFKMWHTGKVEDKTLCGHCRIVRERADGVRFEADKEWTYDMAKRAGTWLRNVHETYPTVMAEWRAFWLAAREVYSDAMRGIPAAEELRDQADYEERMKAADATVVDEPKPVPRGVEGLVAEVEGAKQPPAGVKVTPSAEPTNDHGPGIILPDTDPPPPDPAGPIEGETRPMPDEVAEPAEPADDEGEAAARREADTEDAAEAVADTVGAEAAPDPYGAQVAALCDELVGTDPPGTHGEKLADRDAVAAWLAREIYWLHGKGWVDLGDDDKRIVYEAIRGRKRVANLGHSSRKAMARELRRVLSEFPKDRRLHTRDLHEMAHGFGSKWQGTDPATMPATELEMLLDAVRRERDRR